MYAFLRAEVADAKGRPRDDGVISMLAHHRSDDGSELTDAEHMLFRAQRFIAGNETTRNLISGGMIALAEHPEQLARLVADPSLVPSAVEEMLRWTTPVWLFFRTATRDVVIGDQQIGEGEAVLMSYPAANFDRDEFGPTADDFDIARHPNHHLSFGFGTHFCLGAALARLEAKVLFDAVLGRFSSVTLAGPYRQAASHLLAGILEAPVRLGR